MILHSDGRTKHGRSYTTFDVINEKEREKERGKRGRGKKWLKSTSFSVWVTLLGWVSRPSRGMFENMGKYSPQRLKSGFNCTWRLLK